MVGHQPAGQLVTDIVFSLNHLIGLLVNIGPIFFNPHELVEGIVGRGSVTGQLINPVETEFFG